MKQLQVHWRTALFLIVSGLLMTCGTASTHSASEQIGRRTKSLDTVMKRAPHRSIRTSLKFTMDPNEVKAFPWRSPGPLPPCMDQAMNFSINGRSHKGSHIMHALKHSPAQSGSLITLTFSGICGAFNAPGTIYLRANTSDAEVFRQIFFQHAFDFLDPILKNGPVNHIIDLGTNVGLSLVYWANTFPSAKILGVEPELNNFGMATLNVAHRPNVFLERAAVTDKLGMSNLKSTAPGDWGWGAEPTQRVIDPHSFSSLTIPYLMNRYGWDKVDLLKVDIEGSELALCEDIARGATWIQNVRCITFEYHDRYFTGLKKSIQNTCNEAVRTAGMTFQGHYHIDDLFVWCRSAQGPSLVAPLS